MPCGATAQALCRNGCLVLRAIWRVFLASLARLAVEFRRACVIFPAEFSGCPEVSPRAGKDTSQQSCGNRERSWRSVDCGELSIDARQLVGVADDPDPRHRVVVVD